MVDFIPCFLYIIINNIILNGIEMQVKTELLSLRLQDVTGCKPKRADALVSKYATLVLQQIFQHLNKSTGIDSMVFVSLSDLQNKLGDIKVDGKRYYVFNELQKFKERLITPISVGNNLQGKLTMAQVNYDLEQILIATGDSKTLVEELYKPYVDDEIENIKIDLYSLESYIKGNRNIDRDDPKNAKKIKRIDNYLYHAQRIKLIAQAFNGVMPHVVMESQFGRKYYKGANLQNTPKIVRHAALGTCHEYDVESSVFAWKMSLFQAILKEADDTFPQPATLEYLDHKNAIRKRVAQTVFGSDEDGYINIIKQAITAIGFGANARVSGYVRSGKYEPTALNTIIISQAKLTAFLNDNWVSEFIQEQQTINSAIMGVVKLKGMDQALKAIPELVDNAGRLRTNSVISYLYQQKEREILEEIIKVIEPAEVLLTVHDCIYTRKPAKMLELRECIKQFGDYYDVSHEHHIGFTYDDELMNHKRRIQEEENDAAAYYKKEPKKMFNSDMYTVTKPMLSTTGCYEDRAWTQAEYDPELDPFYNND